MKVIPTGAFTRQPVKSSHPAFPLFRRPVLPDGTLPGGRPAASEENTQIPGSPFAPQRRGDPTNPMVA
jgi:hypothetical protein